MNEAVERPRTYEEGLRDGFIKGQEEANKIIEQMAHISYTPFVCGCLPETEAVKILKAQIQKMKCCYNCKHFENYDMKIDCVRDRNCHSFDKWELKETK